MESKTTSFWAPLNGFLAIQLMLIHSLLLYSYWSIPFFLITFALFGPPLLLNFIYTYGPSSFSSTLKLNTYYLSTVLDLYAYLQILLTILTVLYGTLTLYPHFSLKDFNHLLSLLVFLVAAGYFACNTALTWTFKRAIVVAK